MSIAAVVALAAAVVALASINRASKPVTLKSLQITPGVESLSPSWSVSGSTGLVGFRVEWRLATIHSATWSTPVLLEASARSYTIAGLIGGNSYRVRVQALIASKNRVRVGSTLSGTATALEDLGAGKILWKGDGSEPLYKQWPSIADEEHCGQETSPSNVPDSRITLATTGLAATSSQGRAIRLQLRATDHGCYFGRTELATGNPFGAGKSGYPWTFSKGDEAWIALEAAYPQGYPGGMIQFHENDGPGSPPFGGGPRPNPRNEDELGQFRFHLQDNSRPAGPNREFTLGPAKVAPNTWYKFVFHAKFEENNSGFLYIYLGEGKSTPKLVYSNPSTSLLKRGYSPTHIRIGNYLGFPPSHESVTYIAGFTVATTQAAAEANAFG